MSEDIVIDVTDFDPEAIPPKKERRTRPGPYGISVGLLALGGALVATGALLIAVPAGLIVAGVLICLFAVFGIDDGR